MKTRRLTLIVIVLIIISFLSIGCKRQPSPDAGRGEEIYKGTEGLEMNFIKNMPPDRLYDTTSLNVLLELENEGTYDLSGSRCRLYLSGFDDRIIRGIDKNKQCASSLEGRNILSTSSREDNLAARMSHDH